MQTTRKPPRTFFPKDVNLYRQCPQRYFLEKIAKVRRPHTFSAALIKGGAAHRLLSRHVGRYLRTGRLPERLAAEAREEIQAAPYPDDEQRHRVRDARDVAEWAVAGLEMLPVGAQPRHVERKLFALLSGGPVQLGAQVDLVMELEDGAFEHVDFKTGKRRPADRTQMLISRVVVGNRLGEGRPIRSSVLYVQQGLADSRELAGEDVRADWRDLKRTIREIREATRWPPSPGPLCDYCPYKARDCDAW